MTSISSIGSNNSQFVSSLASQLGVSPTTFQQDLQAAMADQQSSFINDLAGKLGMNPNDLQQAIAQVKSQGSGNFMERLSQVLGIDKKTLEQAFQSARADQQGNFLNDLAQKLGVTPATLSQAMQSSGEHNHNHLNTTNLNSNIISMLTNETRGGSHSPNSNQLVSIISGLNGKSNPSQGNFTPPPIGALLNMTA